MNDPGQRSMEVIRPDEEPVLKTGVGAQSLVSSSLTASALFAGLSSNRKTPASDVGNSGAIPDESTILVPWSNGTTPGPHPGNDGSTPSGTTGPGTPTAERLGLNPRDCRFDSCSGHHRIRLGRQLADHLDSDSGMLWFKSRLSYSFQFHYVLAEQPGVLATLSRWRSWVQIPSGTPSRRGTQAGKAAKLKPW
jgi:hypothetical protein